MIARRGQFAGSIHKANGNAVRQKIISENFRYAARASSCGNTLPHRRKIPTPVMPRRDFALPAASISNLGTAIRRISGAIFKLSRRVERKRYHLGRGHAF